MSVSKSHTPIQTTVHATLISTAVAERERDRPLSINLHRSRGVASVGKIFAEGTTDGNESEMDEQEEEKGDLLFSTHFVV